jgi:hypothetical protein
VLHFVGAGGNNNKNCPKVPLQYKTFYNKIYSSKQDQNKRKSDRATQLEHDIEKNNIETSLMYERTRKQAKWSSFADMETNTNSKFSHTPILFNKKASGGIQLKLTDAQPKIESNLNFAIANFMHHCCGLPFSLAEHPKVWKVLQLAKNAGVKYVAPNPQQVPETLLDINYDHWSPTAKAA